MPSASWVAAATLATAAPSGTSSGRAERASAVGTSAPGITRIASTPSGGSSRTGAGIPSAPGRGQATKPP